MTRYFPQSAFIVLFVLCFLTNIFVYPVFSKYTNITSSDIQRINNYYETELYPQENKVPNTQDEGTSGNRINVTVSNLNWFDSVHEQFPTYTKTRVIDVLTGLTYYVYRNGGHYHADVEPIDKENTAIFFKMYNNEWSWARRAVWVEILPDFWVAASVNGYPHGNAYIKDTGMDGHTCIHFLMSKTHGTKRVDEAHQNCVQYAYDHRDELVKYLM